MAAVCSSPASLVVVRRPRADPVPIGRQRESVSARSPSSVVTGSNDVPVTDLGPADFTVREDGIAREVLRVGPAPLPDATCCCSSTTARSRSRRSAYLRPALTTFVRRIAPTGRRAGRPMPHRNWRSGRSANGRPSAWTSTRATIAIVERAIGRLFHISGAGSSSRGVHRGLEGNEEEGGPAAGDRRVRGRGRPGIQQPDEQGCVRRARRRGLPGCAVVRSRSATQKTFSTEVRERAIVLGDVDTHGAAAGRKSC